MHLININFSTSTPIFRWRPAAWLRVTGGDAESFLQGQFTNDLRALVGGPGAVYGLWLDVKGKVLADSFVLRGSGGNGAGAVFWIGSYFSSAAVIRARLESHVIADDVVIEDETLGWEGVSVLGPGGLKAAAGLPGLVFQGRRGWEESIEWVLPGTMVDEVRTHLGEFSALDIHEMERRRIRAAIPAVPADVGPGDLPQEGALEADAISYTKGCYLGQEVMARLKSMGQLRRRLTRVKGSVGELPALPALLFLGERKIGELRSAVRDERGGFTGLAMLSLLHLTPGATLAWTPGAVPTVQIEDQP